VTGSRLIHAHGEFRVSGKIIAAHLEKVAEMVLGIYIPLVGSLLVQLGSAAQIALHPLAMLISSPKGALGDIIASGREDGILPGRASVVAFALRLALCQCDSGQPEA